MQTSKKKLTIGMATFDDFDGVYFTVWAIAMYHSNHLDEIEILVVDNNPRGLAAEELRNLERSVPGYRYVPVEDVQTPAVKDIIFREASGEWVLVLDSHVLLAPGAIDRLFEFFQHNPDCSDLLQGPMMGPAGSYRVDMEPEWHSGQFGRWGGPVDINLDADPFEIKMQGCGLFACRKDAWPGFNHLFRGHGGEEFYLHEKFRMNGARTLCLPFLVWHHRFPRPQGIAYPIDWNQRIRNMLISWEELGRPIDDLVEHYRLTAGRRSLISVLTAWDKEKRSPLSYFDVLAIMNPGWNDGRWRRLQSEPGISDVKYRLRRFDVRDVEPTGNDRFSSSIPTLMMHRSIIQRGLRESWKSILIAGDDIGVDQDDIAGVTSVVSELEKIEWSVLNLGATRPLAHEVRGSEGAGSRNRSPAAGVTAYHRRSFEKIVEAIPDGAEACGEMLDRFDGNLRILLRSIVPDGYLEFPLISSRRNPIAVDSVPVPV